MVGKKFGRLFVVSRLQPNTSRHDKWNCVCDCGRERTPFGASLRSGETRSCGCVAAEKSKSRWLLPNVEARARQSLKSKTHGLSKSGMYKSWADMKQRCQKIDHKWYPSYGGRGITVCERWLTFENFRQDMADTWLPGLQIGRENNDLGYHKSNCRWETAAQQQANRINTVFVETPNGVMHLSEAARVFQLTTSCIAYRIKAGWCVEQIFRPSQRKKLT